MKKWEGTQSDRYTIHFIVLVIIHSIIEGNNGMKLYKKVGEKKE
ncbi:hypothetical protein [Lysinibacillus sp. G4S2]|nr:hypothetical protein [Lysinibacillus sp. G4S2]MDM5246180.1 hypothetical protein [Lysinibacillus sp. G4S2]